MTAIAIACERCGERAVLSRPGRYCRALCRSRHHREQAIARRAQLATDAETALSSGNRAALEAVARRTVGLLTS